MRRLFGDLADAESGPIGMWIYTAHKYGMNALLEFKPGESAMTPAGQAAFQKRQQSRDATLICHNRYGWPVASLLSEPFKIPRAPKETMILYEVDNLHRQVFSL
jgi:hypothetical protein